MKPLPILQIINLVFGIFFFAWEWPLGFIAGTALHRSIEARLVLLPLTALASALLYQATNPAIYYVIGMGVYFWAYSEGEVRPFSLLFLKQGANSISRLWWQSHGIFHLVPALGKSRRLACLSSGLPHYPPGCNRSSSFRHLAGMGCDTCKNVHILGGGDELELHQRKASCFWFWRQQPFISLKMEGAAVG